MESKYADIDNNCIYIYGEIDETMAMEVTSSLSRMDNRYNVSIYISTYGGDACQAMTIAQSLQVFQENGGHIIITALGACCSGGAFIFLTGNQRLVSNYCYFMLHKGIFSYDEEQVGNIAIDIKHWDNTINSYLDSVLSDTKITKKQIQDKWKGKDWIIKPKDLIKLGFAHRILTKPIRKKKK